MQYITTPEQEKFRQNIRKLAEERVAVQCTYRQFAGGTVHARRHGNTGRGGTRYRLSGGISHRQ